MTILNDISTNLQEGNADAVQDGVEKALASGMKAADILNNGLLMGMSIIGAKFKNNEVYIPEVLVAAQAMKAGLEKLKPHLSKAGVKARGKIVLGTVEGDIHDIGKNMVGMLMEGSGFEVVDLGINVTADSFVKAVQEHRPQIVGMSALLTTTMIEMGKIVKALEKAGVRKQVKVMVGGAPITNDFAKEIGADAYEKDAGSAAEKAKAFVS